VIVIGMLHMNGPELNGKVAASRSGDESGLFREFHRGDAGKLATGGVIARGRDGQ